MLKLSQFRDGSIDYLIRLNARRETINQVISDLKNGNPVIVGSCKINIVEFSPATDEYKPALMGLQNLLETELLRIDSELLSRGVEVDLKPFSVVGGAEL